jgi:AmmeMemoRadiSam system protein A
LDVVSLKQHKGNSMTQDEVDNGEFRFLMAKEHETLVHQVVCRMLFQAANGATTFDANLPTEAAETQISGAFVTLKRDQKLRSCYGCVGGPFRLIAALEQASLGAATKDPRFAPVSSEELPEMHVEVSLLFGIQPITERGLARRETVEVGRHGLVVRTSERSGLLLPRVATDFRLDAERFLQQVCVKAGLNSDKWLDDDVEFETFEAYCFGGPYEMESEHS